ncbi:MAG: hypothetical protein K0S39_4537, partial [Paenibacillus sp.]|nr:hypothetical protein [Paenibacillus sp.]
MKSYTALVEAVLMTSQPGSFVTRRKDSIEVDLGGIPNDRHYGLLRPADSRQKIYPAGTPIANRRQLSLVSAEECERIARNLGVLYILPEWLGANVLLSGYPELTGLPQGARILFQS